MRLVLDASALWNGPLQQALILANDAGALDREQVEAILPAVAFAERLRQIRRDGQDEALFLDLLAVAGVVVEPLTQHTACALSEMAADDGTWRRHARDFLIAAHCARGAVMVTDDDGPAWDGLVRMRPSAAAAAIERLLAP